MKNEKADVNKKLPRIFLLLYSEFNESMILSRFCEMQLFNSS